MFPTAKVQAQISSDTTLPRNSTITVRGNSFIVTDGTRAGENIFHSFREFSVPTGGTASFQQIDSSVDNIISRVTGSSISTIDGVIEVLQSDGAIGSANLFLINPNGIVFGRNASLNIGGSFLATTAHTLNFADGFQFHANGTQSAPVLTMSAPVGLQIGQDAGAIANQSRANLIASTEFENEFGGGLQVAPGRSLALIGNGLSLPGGYLTAEGGHIELGSVSGQGNTPARVRLHETGEGWSFDYAGVQNFQDIQLSERATVNVDGAGGGRIHLRGGEVTLTGRSLLSSVTYENLNGGDIRVRADQLHVDRFSGIRTLTLGSGNSGNIAVRTAQLRIQRGGRISAATLGQGTGGNISITASESVVIDGEDSVRYVGGDISVPSPNISAQSTAEATGDGGSVTIETELLQLENGAQVSVVTLGSGNSGSIRVHATDIELSDILRDPQGEVITNYLSRPFPSGLFTGTREQASGNGGALVIETERLNLQDGAAIKTNTEGSGNSGNLTIRASDAIEVSGTAGAGLPPTFILAASGSVPNVEPYLRESFVELLTTGQGGTLDIQTRELRVQDGAVIAVGSLNPEGSAGAGTLLIEAETVRLSNQGRLLSETASGNGGNMVLQVQDFLLLQRNSDISTSAGRVRAGGNGGDIAIATNFIIANSLEDSDISADAYRDRGGNVDIEAQSLLGIAPQQQNNFQTSDITASSELGIDGVIQINSPDVDPSEGVVELTETAVDVSRLIAQRCFTGRSAVEQRQSEFVVTGRGGLPTSPNDSTNSTIFWEDLRPPVASTAAFQSPNQLPQTPIMEAQGWNVNSDGKVVLTADSSPITVNQSRQATTRCQQTS
jgi:filamentous hemagglutinin family protein